MKHYPVQQGLQWKASVEKRLTAPEASPQPGGAALAQEVAKLQHSNRAINRAVWGGKKLT